MKPEMNHSQTDFVPESNRSSIEIPEKPPGRQTARKRCFAPTMLKSPNYNTKLLVTRRPRRNDTMEMNATDINQSSSNNVQTSCDEVIRESSQPEANVMNPTGPNAEWVDMEPCTSAQAMAQSPWPNTQFAKQTAIAKHNFAWRQRQNRNLERSYGVGSGKGGMKRMVKVLRKDQQSFSLRNLNKLQQAMSIKKEIPIAPITRLVRELLESIGGRDATGKCNMKIQAAAISAIHEATEGYLVCLFENCYDAAVHRNRTTLMVKDFHYILRQWTYWGFYVV